MNQYLIGNNLDIVKGIKCDLIYIDPPYNTGRDFGDYKDSWKSMKVYAEEFLYPRIKLCYDILKNNGNIVVHIEPKNSHWVRFILDDIFGSKFFRNEIVWKTGGNAKNKKQLGRMHDTILVYSKTNKFTFNPQYKPYSKEYLEGTKLETSLTSKKRNSNYTTTAIHNSQPDVNPRPNLRYEWNGHSKQWYVSKEKMQSLHNEERLEYNSKGIPRVKRYVDELDGIPITDLWTDINNTQSGEKVNYATQKPIKLLDRIIKMYSNEKDTVVDIFAGSGTTGVSAIKNNRNYYLYDINPKGKKIFDNRIKN
jgi:adenine specific DNA methylase Mod